MRKRPRRVLEDIVAEGIVEYIHLSKFKALINLRSNNYIANFEVSKPITGNDFFL
jgi:hypothetical protein